MPKKRQVAIERIFELLKQEDELSIRQIAYKLRMHRGTAVRWLEVLKKLDVVKERENTENKRSDRLFSLKKK